ncbi:MAG TPA: ABC transporter ATP-binding protein [Acidimicrobiales bacterium]|nr:ABC transporter ATP-binding protein [Acidimicrobiales bacterium]
MSERLDAPPAVELVDVHKHFDGGQVHALDGLDLVVRTGEFVAVTGPSGCGKSTMLQLVAALDRPTSGAVRVNGTDLSRVRHLARYRRLEVGLVFQLHDLLPQLDAVQNIEVAMFGTARSLSERRHRAVALLEMVDLSGKEDRTPARLSGGERQRVAIARALANDPALLLADEPTGSLDEDSIARVLGLLADLRRGRPELTIILVTHDAAVAARADRTVYLRAGRIDAERTSFEARQAGEGAASGR